MGELEKRIKECISDYWRETEGDNAITRAIREAKKEFPYRPLNERVPLNQQLLKLARDRHIWFVKWFGDGE